MSYKDAISPAQDLELTRIMTNESFTRDDFIIEPIKDYHWKFILVKNNKYYFSLEFDPEKTGSYYEYKSNWSPANDRIEETQNSTWKAVISYFTGWLRSIKNNIEAENILGNRLIQLLPLIPIDIIQEIQESKEILSVKPAEGKMLIESDKLDHLYSLIKDTNYYNTQALSDFKEDIEYLKEKIDSVSKGHWTWSDWINNLILQIIMLALQGPLQNAPALFELVRNWFKG